jgi:hypothetical protein
VTAQYGMPRLTTPFVTADGHLTDEWARFLLKIFQVTGGSTAVPVMAYEAIDGSAVNIYDASTGDLLGELENAAAPGVAPAAVALGGGSPLVYTAPSAGFVLVAGAQVELRRSTATWWLASPNGGSFALRAGDSVRVTWTDPAVPPSVSWWGN